MAIKTNEIELFNRFFPDGYIHAITGYHAKTESIGSTLKTEFHKIAKPVPLMSAGGLMVKLSEMLLNGATRAEFQVLDKTGKKDFIEFHIERLIPPEMKEVSKEKDVADFIDLVRQMRQWQKQYWKMNEQTRGARNETIDKTNHLETAVDLKLAEFGAPDKKPHEIKNQTSLF